MTAALTIAFVPGVSPAKWVRVWRDRHPDVELLVRPIGHDQVDEVLAGDADMVFARLPVSDALHAIPLWTETAVVAMPKDAPLAERDDVTEADLAELDVLDSGPVPADVDAVLDLVEANVGVAVLPQSLFRAASRKDLVARALVGSPGTRVALVWRDDDATETTEEFIGVVRGRTANSSRRPQDQSADTEAEATTRPSRSGSGTGGKGAKAGTAGGKATAAKQGGGKKGGNRQANGKAPSTGRGRGPGIGKTKGKPSRGSKGNR
ncbi:LysR family transcriptional regulator substrate-binding protein [Curtobacterium sp. ISL-83]|uniref:LysR family transcriptional regulator substrate-binding protein n=1 Tax=Curtobacterium sp. ISL-83 TaxID=2819145 RepID=UPI001BE9E052|nr:LysR family transcriptional regulator substrate-binding protein [Curtobacterium sp. ISL-83]MBT2503429.1 LysR family transcriptional regulator substrate-binding protein [Curtobacterium sp. ISL-83]